MQPNCACLLFDLDGTLCETDPVHLRAFNQVLEPFGLNFDMEEYSHRVMGRTNQMVLAELLPHLDVSEHDDIADRKEALFRAMATSLEPQQGLLALLDWAATAGVPTAIVTNAPRANAEMVLDAIGLTGRFDAVIIAHDLPRQKPDPLPYLTGLARLGGEASRSVAFEDSGSGITAAVAAGLATVGLASSLSNEDLLKAGATVAVRDFTDHRIQDLIQERAGLT
jgi:HAD superfamily hydrolase (TIGR01509 family)